MVKLSDIVHGATSPDTDIGSHPQVIWEQDSVTGFADHALVLYTIGQLKPVVTNEP